MLCTSLVPEDMGIMYITGSWGHGYYVHHWFLGTWVLCPQEHARDMGVMYISGCSGHVMHVNVCIAGDMSFMHNNGYGGHGYRDMGT